MWCRKHGSENSGRDRLLQGGFWWAGTFQDLAVMVALTDGDYAAVMYGKAGYLGFSDFLDP